MLTVNLEAPVEFLTDDPDEAYEMFRTAVADETLGEYIVVTRNGEEVKRY